MTDALRNTIQRILEETQTVIQGHFLLTSGLHSPTYVEKFRILQFPRHTQFLCSLIADHYWEERIDVVAGPTTGGVILAYEVARQLNVRGIFAERVDERRIFRRSLTISPGEKVLVVDDILTTGGSVQQVLDAVKEEGGQVTGIGVLIDRSSRKIDFGAPLFGCYRLDIPTYVPSQCPLCADGTPLSRPGGDK